MSDYGEPYYSSNDGKKKTPLAYKVGGAVAGATILTAIVLGSMAAAGVFGKSSTNGTVFNIEECVDCKHCQLLLHNNPVLKTGKHQIDLLGESVDVYCDMETDGGGWTVFQRRLDGSVDFNRNWNDYEKGFGNLEKEHWLGLEILSKLTQSSKCLLRVDIEYHPYKDGDDFGKDPKHAEWTTFKVEDSTQNYKLKVDDYKINKMELNRVLSNDLVYHNGAVFSTRDRDNDKNRVKNCAQDHKGGNWYKNCAFQSVNGRYYNGPASNVEPPEYAFWNPLRYRSLKSSKMMVRNC